MLCSETRNTSDTSACFSDEAATHPDGESEWEDIDSDEEPMRSSLKPTHQELALRECLSDKDGVSIVKSNQADENDRDIRGTGSKEAIATSSKKITAAERDSAYHKKEMVCKGGPNGPPVYDELGYQLDYYKVTGRPTKLGKSWYKSEKEFGQGGNQKKKDHGHTEG